MENIWKAENERLKSKIYVNEKLIRNIHIGKSVSTFKSLFNTSVLGRNLALVYATISLILAVIYLPELKYSVPLVIGAAGMVISFIQHLALKRPKDYYEATVLELQKSIQRFRIHTQKHKYFDIFFVVLWILTLTPVYYKWRYGLDVYDSTADLFTAFTKLAVIMAVVFGVTWYLYNSYDKKLSESISVLKELEEFESEMD